MRILQLALALLVSTLFVGVVSAVGAEALTPSVMYGASQSAQDACSSLNVITGKTNPDCSNLGDRSKSFTDILGIVVQIISFVAGIIAVIMVLSAGFKYITSSGDSSKVSAAKSSLIYALIGIAVAVTAQSLVHFAINTSTDATTTCKYDKKLTSISPECVKPKDKDKGH